MGQSYEIRAAGVKRGKCVRASTTDFTFVTDWQWIWRDFFSQPHGKLATLDDYYMSKTIMCQFSSGAVFIIQCFVLLIQYMISALSDCVPVIQQVKHESSAQVMLDAFEKEISDTLHEVSRRALCQFMSSFSFISLTKWATLIRSQAKSDYSLTGRFFWMATAWG